MFPEIKPPSLDEIQNAVRANSVGNSEINQALKEFEVKSTDPQIGGVEENTNLNTNTSPEMPKMVQFVIKHSFGLVKEQKGAEYVLLGVVILAIIVSLFLVLGGGGKNKQQELPSMVLEEIKQMPINK